MEALFEFIKSYGTQLSAIGVAFAFMFGAYKFQAERRTALFWREFEVYHRLVKELVEPLPETGMLYIDRQAAVIFEMRNFKRYYPYTLRMLEGLQTKWSALPDRHSRLLNEVEFTIDHIKKLHTKRRFLCVFGWPCCRFRQAS